MAIGGNTALDPSQPSDQLTGRGPLAYKDRTSSPPGLPPHPITNQHARNRGLRHHQVRPLTPPWCATPSVSDSLIPFFMPVYPGAPERSPRPGARNPLGHFLDVPVRQATHPCARQADGVRRGRHRATRSCCSTATRRRRTCGATSSRTSPASVGASPPTSSGWATPTSSTRSGPGSYTFVEHRRYLDALLDAARRERAGGVRRPRLGLGARVRLGQPPPRRRRRGRLHGGHRPPAHLGHWPDAARGIFQAFRSPAGEEMVLEQERVRRAGPTGLGAAHPHRRRDGRVPPALPRARRGPPTDAHLAPTDPDRRRTGRRHRHRRRATPTGWRTSALPKLFISADPGAILPDRNCEFCRTWPNQAEVTVPGNHFLQEDSPDEIGAAIADWITSSVRR